MTDEQRRNLLRVLLAPTDEELATAALAAPPIPLTPELTERLVEAALRARRRRAVST